jgi:hypothetical protein
MEGHENHEPPRFCIEVNVPRGGRKLAVQPGLRAFHIILYDMICYVFVWYVFICGFPSPISYDMLQITIHNKCYVSAKRANVTNLKNV